jgi:hypothetical protein
MRFSIFLEKPLVTRVKRPFPSASLDWAFDVGGAYVLGVGIAADGFHIRTEALGGTISAPLGIGRCAVYLLQLGVINVRPKGIL